MVNIIDFFFQAEDGIRDEKVTGVQTCALPIYIKIIAKEGCFQTHSNILIHCYLGVIEIDKLCINDDEVAEVFTVPIDFFMENEPDIEYVEVIPRPDEHFPYEKIHFPNGYKWAKGCNEIPIYNFEGRPIWGITARITHDFIRVMKGEKK